MQLKIQETRELIECYFIGSLDTLAANECEPQLSALKDKADRHIELDFSELEYISSSGLRLLITLLKGVKQAGGQLSIRNMNDVIKEVFTLTGFISLFDVKNI